MTANNEDDRKRDGWLASVAKSCSFEARGFSLLGVAFFLVWLFVFVPRSEVLSDVFRGAMPFKWKLVLSQWWPLGWTVVFLGCFGSTFLSLNPRVRGALYLFVFVAFLGAVGSTLWLSDFRVCSLGSLE
jgi:hypothetical protein